MLAFLFADDVHDVIHILCIYNIHPGESYRRIEVICRTYRECTCLLGGVAHIYIYICSAACTAKYKGLYRALHAAGACHNERDNE